MTRRIGIYSGTFDPIHTGHVAFAVQAREAGALDSVFFIPEPSPRQKENVTDLRHRLAMLRSALKNDSRLQALELASNRFTIKDTLPELQRLFPDDRLVFLIGSDIVGTLVHWEGLASRLVDIEFIVGLRGNDSVNNVRHVIDQAFTGQLTYRVVTGAEAHAASSIIRNGNPEDTPAEVRDYITEHRLYTK